MPPLIRPISVSSWHSANDEISLAETSFSNTARSSVCSKLMENVVKDGDVGGDDVDDDDDDVLVIVHQ